MQMVTIPNQSSDKAYAEFDDAGRMKPPSYYHWIVDVMEDLAQFTCCCAVTQRGRGRN
jgi:arsenic resistance protein ArsH